MKLKTKKFWEWLVLSSKNPAKVSLMIKGVLTSAIPFVLLATNTFGLEAVTEVGLREAANDTGSLVMNGLTIVSLAVAGYGLMRKIWNSLTGTKPESWE